MRFAPGAVTTGLVILSLTRTLTAHHAVDETYDLTKIVTLQGVVSKIEWTNPHVRMYVDVVRGDGTTLTWFIEAGPPNAYRRSGIDPAVLKTGAPVIVDAWPAKDGSQAGSIRAITLPDGRTFSNGPPMWTRQSNR